MGGTPLNNDVWYLDIGSIQKIPRNEAPLTRAFYLNYTYNMSWSEEPNAPWSPRAGLGAIAQFYFNESTQTVGQGAYRLLVLGGYGGWLEQSAAVFPYSVGDYDGFRCREDVWSMDSTGSWELLTNNASFQGTYLSQRKHHVSDTFLSPSMVWACELHISIRSKTRHRK